MIHLKRYSDISSFILVASVVRSSRCVMLSPRINVVTSIKNPRPKIEFVVRVARDEWRWMKGGLASSEPVHFSSLWVC